MKSWLVLLLVCLAACGDSTGTNDQFVREFAFDDSVGDTALFAGSVGSFPALDVRRVSGMVTTDSLTFTMEFAGPVASVADAAPNSLQATLAIDADDDGTTGTQVDSTADSTSIDSTSTDSTSSDSTKVPPFTGPFPARTGVGAEYWVFVDQLSNGAAEVRRAGTFDHVGTFPISYSGNSVTMRIPLSAIGVPAAHPFRVVGIVGTSQRLTDLIPDSSSYLLGGSS